VAVVIFGTGLGASMGAFTSHSGYTYQEFLLSGIIGQSLLFTAVFMGISVIWDRRFGFMKEILVAPVSRVSIYIGKMLGVGTGCMFRGVIVLALGFIIGVPLGLATIGMAFLIMVLITAVLVCIGLIIASMMKSLESFGTIATFVNMPMFFFSGALFPVSNLPQWLQWAFYLNSLTYGVDALNYAYTTDYLEGVLYVRDQIGQALVIRGKHDEEEGIYQDIARRHPGILRLLRLQRLQEVTKLQHRGH
jgi:ABC-2 type transport system permease protein